MLGLVVTHAFGPYATGATITDPQLIAELQDSPNVVRANLPDPQAPADAQAPDNQA